MTERQTQGVLDEARGVRAMTAVIAIMLFLTVLAAALGLATRSATAALDRQLAGRVTVQVDEPAATRAQVALRDLPGVAKVRRVPADELARLLAPWLGDDAADADLPLPALIDVDVRDDAAAAAVGRAVAGLPGVRVDRQADWMAPVARLLASVTWLALALVLLMLAATASVVVLAARAGLDAHRGTIDVMHMLGSTDVQVARLFQRRIARDAALGGIVGAAAGLGVVALIGSRVASLGSELAGSAALGTAGWILLALLPLAFVALAAVAARVAVIARLRAML